MRRWDRASSRSDGSGRLRSAMTGVDWCTARKGRPPKLTPTTSRPGRRGPTSAAGENRAEKASAAVDTTAREPQAAMAAAGPGDPEPADDPEPAGDPEPVECVATSLGIPVAGDGYRAAWRDSDGQRWAV